MSVNRMRRKKYIMIEKDEKKTGINDNNQAN